MCACIHIWLSVCLRVSVWLSPCVPQQRRGSSAVWLEARRDDIHSEVRHISTGNNLLLHYRNLASRFFRDRSTPTPHLVPQPQRLSCPNPSHPQNPHHPTPVIVPQVCVCVCVFRFCWRILLNGKTRKGYRVYGKNLVSHKHNLEI